MRIEVEIFNMNDIKREVYECEESSKFFEEEIEIISEVNVKNNFFSLLGVEVNGLKFRIKNREKFILHIISKYFPGYKITKPKGVNVGHPDFLLIKDDKEIYLELKIGSDTLRQTQMSWFADNKDKNNKVIFINWEDDFSLDPEGSI